MMHDCGVQGLAQYDHAMVALQDKTDVKEAFAKVAGIRSVLDLPDVVPMIRRLLSTGTTTKLTVVG